MTVTETAVAQRQSSSLARRDELTIEDMIAQVTKVHDVMARVMKDGEHYGVIPGTGSKPTLLKPGAEKLCMLFRLDPQYQSAETFEGKHLTVKTTCTLYHIPTGERWGSGEGSCSTKESKYAYRESKRLCPKCGRDAIIRGKKEYGGGWLCFAKKFGCGSKFLENDATIMAQEVGRVANEDLADQYNTVLKMSNKRALVAAVLNVTAASDIFTQDIEDLQQAEPTRTDTISPGLRIGESASGGVGRTDAPIDDAAGLFPKPEDEERQALAVEAQRLVVRLKLKEEQKREYLKTYLGGADLLAPNLDIAALTDLVNVLLIRAGEPKWGTKKQ
jgi:hypothetical protein